MNDTEKVIKGLKICSEYGAWHGIDCELSGAYKDCPYRGCETGCVVTIAKDAIALLKEQEAKHVTDPGAICPKCKMPIFPEEHPHYCGHCGQAVTFDD